MSHTCCQRVKWGPIHDRSFCTAVPASSSFSHILYARADRYQLLQIALTNGIHVRSVKRCARLYARRSSRRDLGAVYWSRFFEMLEILPRFRIVEGDCLFEPNPGKVDVPLHSRSIEIKHSEIVHRLCIAKLRRVFK